MLFKRKRVPAVAWDEKTSEHFAKRDRFDVSITSVTKTFGFGTMIFEPIRYEVRGIITDDVPVVLEVSKKFREEEEIGGWLFEALTTSDWWRIPSLHMWVNDPQHEIAEALYEAHKAAIACGRRTSKARFWKRPGDGVMTALEIKQGYSATYPLLRCITWSLYQSQTLPLDPLSD